MTALRWTAIGVSIALFIGSIASIVYFLGGGAGNGGSEDAGTLGSRRICLRDAAEEAGLDFTMRFLPDEQGANFKINLYDHGCGVVVGDYNGDGRDDIYFLNQLGSNALFQNREGGTFEDVTSGVGPIGLEDRICTGGTFADFDNDGDQDLFVTSTRGGNVLFRNENGKGFTDVTAQAGLTCLAHSQTAAFFDYDEDGDLDLYVTNSAAWTSEALDESARYHPGVSSIEEILDSPKEYDALYRNNGDGTFTDGTEAANLQSRGWSGDVAVFDFDEDGHLDLLVTNMFGLSRLHRNLGGGRFRDVTASALRRTSYGAIGCKPLDFDNDGRLDLLIADMHSDMWMDPFHPPSRESIEPAKRYAFLSGPAAENDALVQLAELERAKESGFLDHDRVLFGNTLFRNRGGGRFAEVSSQAGLETFWPWGIASGDLDNDGFEDVMLPSGMGYPFFYWPNQLMMNDGDGTFTDRALELGLEPPSRGTELEATIGGQPAARSSRCAATADFDGDGRLEIVVNNFNDRPYYFKNEFPRRNYVAFRLRGTRSNRDAVGASVKLHMGREIMVRQVHAAGGYLSQSSKMLHFGLGDRSRIDRVEVRWPSGLRQELKGPSINRMHDLVEPGTDAAPADAAPASSLRGPAAEGLP